MAWVDERQRPSRPQIYFVRLDAEGAPVGPEVQVTDASGPRHDPHLVWTGAELAIAWRDERHESREIFVARIADDTLVGQWRITEHAASSTQPALFWTGTGYGLAWTDQRDGGSEIYFTTLDSSASRTAADIRVTEAPGLSVSPVMTWSGERYAIAWQDDRANPPWKVYFARLDPGGNKLGEDLQVNDTTGHAHAPDIVWGNGAFSLAWTADADGGGVYFARVDEAGASSFGPLRIDEGAAAPEGAQLAWTGTGFVVTWADFRSGDRQIYATRLDGSGRLLGGEVQVTRDAVLGPGHSMARGTAVVWSDERDDASHVFFQRICP